MKISKIIAGGVLAIAIYGFAVPTGSSSTVKRVTRGTSPDCRGDWYKATKNHRVLGTQYFVSAAGSDAANGLSPATAWQTIAKVNASAFNNTDQVNFRAGDIFFGSVVVHWLGLTWDYTWLPYCISVFLYSDSRICLRGKCDFSYIYYSPYPYVLVSFLLLS